MRARLLSSLVVLLALALSSRLDAYRAAPAGSLAFTISPSGLIEVPVMINGTGPFLFVLDTGANRSAISDRLARRLQLQPVATTETVTTTGTGRADVMRLDTVQIGSHTATSLLTPVLVGTQLRAVHPNADGIIGQDVLIDAHYTLDYRRRRLTWRDAGADDGAGLSGTRLRLRRSEGRLLVELPQQARTAGHPWLVPDSGASMLVLFEHGGQTTIQTSATGGTQALATVSGEGRARSARVSRLQVGRDTLWDVPAVLVAGQTDEGGGRIDGLLPLSQFSSVTFNGPAHYLIATR